jgi:phosphatidylglycerophosphate synthase
MVARAYGVQSSFGSFFDNFCSAYTDSAVFGGLIVAELCDPWWGVAALVGTLSGWSSRGTLFSPGTEHSITSW